MDVFKHNWTQRMKNEPYINYTLNKDKKHHGKIRWKTKHIDNDYNLIETQMEQDMHEAADFGRKYFSAANIFKSNLYGMQLNKRYGVAGSLKLELQGMGQLYDNSRPNSLYNLHYASSR